MKINRAHTSNKPKVTKKQPHPHHTQHSQVSNNPSTDDSTPIRTRLQHELTSRASSFLKIRRKRTTSPLSTTTQSTTISNSLLSLAHRSMGTPAGDRHHSFAKNHPSINQESLSASKKSLLGIGGPNMPLLGGESDPNAPTSTEISSAFFANTAVSTTTIQVGNNIIQNLPSPAMFNIDPSLYQYIDDKSWLTLRKVDDALPPGLPSDAVGKIREFQSKLPAPMHIDSCSILALPKHLGGFGFEHLTFVQGKLLPMIASGLDILLRAPTSSGKTLAYAIPLVERLIYSRHAPNSRDIPIIVILPTRELALQTTATVKHLLSLHERTHTRNFGVFSLVGGSSSARVEQEPLMRTDIGFLVCTTQRLLDHIDNTPGFKERLKSTKMVVLDEVDYLLAQTGGTDIGHVLKELNPQRQTIMLSATLTPAVRKVASFALRKGACVVDVVKDSIVSLGTGLSSSLSSTPDTEGTEENVQKGENLGEMMEFDQDEHDLLVKRQQQLVGEFVNEKGEVIHIDQSDIVDKLGTGQLVYEKKPKHILQQEADAKKRKLKQEENEEYDESNDEYEIMEELDHSTGKMIKKRRKIAINSTNSNQYVNEMTKNTLTKADFPVYDRSTPTEIFLHDEQSKLRLKRQGLMEKAGISDETPENTEIDPITGNLRKKFEAPIILSPKAYKSDNIEFLEDVVDDFLTKNIDEDNGIEVVDYDEFGQVINPKKDESELEKAEAAQKRAKLAAVELEKSKTAREHPQTAQSREVDDLINDARKKLDSTNIGTISTLLKQNEAITDELAIYSDNEDDEMVLFEEVNTNVQHYVQSANIGESLLTIARLFDDIGGRFIYAKQQVEQHNLRIQHDPTYVGESELEPPKPPKIMVFCETARFAQYLSALYRRVIELDKSNAFEAILELHSKKGQNYRTRVAQSFSSEEWSAGAILFSSDVAARGLDTKDVDCVIQLGMPPSRQQWVHRVGRVARDGDQQGISLTLINPEHVSKFAQMTSGLPIHVPAVGSLGLGVKQDQFNNTVVDPSKKVNLHYKPIRADNFGELGEFDDTESSTISGKLRKSRKDNGKDDVKLLGPGDEDGEEIESNIVPYQDGEFVLPPRRQGAAAMMDGEFSENAQEYNQYEEELSQDFDESGEDDGNVEQTLWHGTIERAVAGIYLERLSDENDRSQRYSSLNSMTMSSNTGELATELYARFDFHLRKELGRVRKDEELLLNAERAYVSYLGHHMALYQRSKGIQEKLKIVKLSDSPFKNKQQVAQLALEFAKGVGLCGPRNDLAPPAISPKNATRLGFDPEKSHNFINIGIPTQFTHIVELDKREQEKKAKEQQRIDHRERRKYWEAKQRAIAMGRPIPPEPKAIIDQRKRKDEERERRNQEMEEERQKFKELHARNVASKYGGRKPLQQQGIDFDDDERILTPNQAKQGEVIRSTARGKTNLVGFSDDETMFVKPAAATAFAARNMPKGGNGAAPATGLDEADADHPYNNPSHPYYKQHQQYLKQQEFKKHQSAMHKLNDQKQKDEAREKADLHYEQMNRKRERKSLHQAVTCLKSRHYTQKNHAVSVLVN